jgi:predicted RNA-binding Zn-ribbon protein involved in translation (DUF1610 family)
MDENPPEQTTNPYATPGSSLQGNGGRSLRVHCPHCGTLTDHSPVDVVREKMGGRGIILFLVTGIVLYLLWEAQKPRIFRCTSCGELFYARTQGANIAGKALSFLIVLLLALLLWPNL